MRDWISLSSTLMENPENLPDYRVLKYSPTVTVFRARFSWSGGSLGVVCKHGEPSGLMHRLRSRLRGPRERRSFNLATRLHTAGIPVPLPLAILERANPTPQAWLICEYWPDLIDLSRASSRIGRARHQLTQRVADLFGRLDRAGVRHRDLKASNIMVMDDSAASDRVTVGLVDLEGVRRRVFRRSDPNLESDVRLVASLLDVPGVTLADLVRLIKHRLPLATSGERKRTVRRVFRRAEAYAAAARRRKSHKLDGYAG